MHAGRKCTGRKRGWVVTWPGGTFLSKLKISRDSSIFWEPEFICQTGFFEMTLPPALHYFTSSTCACKVVFYMVCNDLRKRKHKPTGPTYQRDDLKWSPRLVSFHTWKVLNSLTWDTWVFVSLFSLTNIISWCSDYLIFGYKNFYISWLPPQTLAHQNTIWDAVSWTWSRRMSPNKT